MIEYPPCLEDDMAIMCYIESVSPDSEESFATYYKQYQEVCEQLSKLFPGQDIIRKHTALLQAIPIEELKEGDPDYNKRDFAKEEQFVQMDPDTMPPLVVNANLEIEDGNHRYRAAKKMQLKTLNCYLIQNVTEY